MRKKENKSFWEKHEVTILAILFVILCFALPIFLAAYSNHIESHCIQRETVCYKISESFWGKQSDKIDCNSNNWDIKQEECTMVGP